MGRQISLCSTSEVSQKAVSEMLVAYDSNFERAQSLRLSQQRAEKAENEVARLEAELEALKKKWKWADDRIKGLDLILFIDIFSKCRRIGEFEFWRAKATTT